MSVAGLGASTLVKSPEQLAAEAEAPKASVISATVERRVLRETVTLRGTVAPGRTIEVSPAASAEAGKLVVSAPPLKVGRRVRAGEVVSVISGRPIIALPGKVPAYRDLRQGMKGPDVVQVQSALRSLGYAIADNPGIYGVGTQAAVKRLFEVGGFDPVVEEVPTAEKPTVDDPQDKGKPEKPKKAVVLRSGEVVFVPKFPARVIEAKAALGAEVKGVVLKLAAGELVVQGRLSQVDRKLVKAGRAVKILSEETGIEARGRVVSIGPFVTGEGGDGTGPAEPGHPIVVEGVRPLPEKLAGQDVRLTIEAASTDKPVLVVPASAIYAVADGSTQVVKIGADGTQARVTVTTGALGGGFVEVKTDELQDGDKVVVGAG
ncbi:hypothetical protein GCM10027589_09810 [Actinocorallia lasiicapitis]